MRNALYENDSSLLDTEAPRLIPVWVGRVISAAVFVGLITGISLWAYDLGLRDANEVPVIRAMAGPSRIKPEEPGGVQVAHQGHEINAVIAGSPAPVPRQSVKTLPAEPILTEEDRAQGALIPAITEPVNVKPAEPDAATLQSAILESVKRAQAEEDAAKPVAPEEPVVYDTGPRPIARPSYMRNSMRLRGRQGPIGVREVASLPPGARVLQLGTFDSAEHTRLTWQELVQGHSDLLSSKSLYVQRATDSSRVFYRLRVAGFASPEETTAMCAALEARKVDCLATTLRQ